MWNHIFGQERDHRHYRQTSPRARTPRQMANWCASQPAEIAILDDSARVDLTWWNERIRGQGLDIRLLGRGPDGQLVETGEAEITRSDLLRCREWDFCDVPDRYVWGAQCESSRYEITPAELLMMLYMCTAWASAHRGRDFAKRFPTLATPDSPTGVVRVHPGPMVAANASSEAEVAYERIMGLGTESFFAGAGFDLPRKAPGITWRLGTLFLANISWIEADPPLVPMSRASMSLIVQAGYSGFSLNRDPSIRDYANYQHVVRNWAIECRTWPELVEIWLSRQWMAQAAASNGRSRSVW